MYAVGQLAGSHVPEMAIQRRGKPTSERDRAVAATREGKTVDFKSRFDPGSEAECVEFVKDLVAMANSGGGFILVGVHDDAKPSGTDVSTVLRLDPAHLTDKVFRYTGEHFSGFAIDEATRGAAAIAVIEVNGSDELLVFTRPGNYMAENGKQKTAFSSGGVYFRHGAKSEPCTPSDLRRHVEGLISTERSRWMKGIRQVVEARRGTEVAVIERTRRDAEGKATRVRLTNDPDAPVFGRLNPDDTHPHRMSGLIALLNKRLEGRAKINQHDILGVRRAYNIDEKSRPEFAYKPNYDSMHYSDSFLEWLDDQFTRDSEFFQKARIISAQRRK
jgi:Putative DNA-binding domain